MTILYILYGLFILTTCFVITSIIKSKTSTGRIASATYFNVLIVCGLTFLSTYKHTHFFDDIILLYVIFSFGGVIAFAKLTLKNK